MSRRTSIKCLSLTHLSSLIGCNFLRYVTLFSCDTFGFYVSWVYLQYGVQVITRQFPESIQASESPDALDGALVGIILALLMLVTSYLFRTASQSSLFHRHVRRFLADYGMPISLVATSAMAYWGKFNHANPSTLPVSHAFQPAGGREWLVRFWQLDAKWVGIAFPFGFALWVLFFFDHNVSVSPPRSLHSVPAHTHTRASRSWLKDRSFPYGNHRGSITISFSLGLRPSLPDSLAFLHRMA